MNVFSRWRRSATAFAAVAAVVPLVIAAAPQASANAAVPHTAKTAPFIQSVSYGRFRSLLQQPGDSAFLIGSPAKDSSFTARAHEAAAAAQAAGLKKIYWFNPTVSGVSGPSTSSWRTLVGQDLESLSNTEPATAGEAEHARITGSNSYFFVSYRQTGFAPGASTKIISWIDLSTQPSVVATRTDVTTAVRNDSDLVPEDLAATAHLSPRADSGSGCSPEITNLALHPYKIQVTIDGQVYNDGCDTLPGDDDFACTPIPDVQYDFADNLIFYYNDQGDLLATAPWTEWQRITSYTTWEQQQEAAAAQAGSGSSGSGSSGSGSSGSGSSGSGSSGSGSSGSGSSGSGSTTASGSGSSGSGSGSSSSGSSSSDSLLSRSKVKKVVGAVTKAPTSKAAGKYKITIDTPTGKTTATGKVTVRIYKVGAHTATVTGELSRGVVTVKVPKLSKGTWNVLISWPGNTKYQADSATGGSIKVVK